MIVKYLRVLSDPFEYAAGGNNASAAELRTLGIDSVFFGFGNWKQSCGSDYAKVEQSSMQHTTCNAQHVAA